MVSLMEFNDSIRVLSPLYRLSSKRRVHYKPHYLGKTNLYSGHDFRQLFISLCLLLSFNNQL